MLRDASHQQVIQKFSFIESLNLSRGINRQDREVLNRVDIDRAFDFVPQIAAKSNSQNLQTSSAMVTSSARSATIDTNWHQAQSDNSSSSLTEIVKYSTPDNRTKNHEPKARNYLGKILFSLACSYSIFVLWWLFGHRAGQIWTTLRGGKQIVISQSDIEFIEQVERSLVSIERQAEANKSSANGDNTVVYIPVYTPTSTPLFPQASSNNLPLTTLSNNTAPTIPKPEALKIPAPPPLPAPNPISPNSSSPAPTDVAAVITKPAIKHTLTGILELGVDKSAALIKINGQTRRFWSGEKIGNSDWILESVSDQTAKISDRGQVRYIVVGETF